MSAARLPQTPAWWFNGEKPPWWARLLAFPYGVVTALRRGAYQRGWLRRQHPGVPVIVVGNLVAGGSGKTPLVIALVEHLRAAGWTPGVASRGYGRQQANTARWIEPGMSPELAGDEPLFLAQASGVSVRVDRDRVAAAQALRDKGCDIIVCDDGLQHYALRRDIEIEVQDARRRYGNGQLLPAGPLREPIERAADCTFRVVNWGVAQAPDECDTGEWSMALEIGTLRPLSGGRGVALAAWAGQRVHAVAGIGEPERFFSMLRNAGLAVVPHAYPDHHAYRVSDLEFGSPLPLLMTEKDAVKCTHFQLANAWSVPIRAQLPAAFWQVLHARLAALDPSSRG